MFYDAIANNHGLPNDPFKSLVMPRPIGWISSLSKESIVNLAPYSFFNAFAEDPHYVGIGAGRRMTGARKDTLANVEATGEFTLSLATWELREGMNATSAQADPAIDEFELAGLEKAPSHFVKPPRVKASPAALECRLFKIVELPGEDGAVENNLILGRVVGIYINDRFIENGRVNSAAMHPIARLGYSEYATVTEAWRMRRPP
jgi:flavin reductase (DIM6/NTAB) family NADH-FMN oxidoreductase RutF